MNRVRLGFCLLFVCSLSPLTAAASSDAVRFTASPGVVQIRVEVLSPIGTALYDSDWKNGNVLDWPVPVLPYGSYGVRIQSRDLEGRASEKQTTLRVAPEGVTVDSAGSDLKLTTTLHNGESGQIVTTSGDLSFRFGDFLNRKDTEAMRLTAHGDLDVAGLIRTGKGIVFPDGSIQRSATPPTIMRMRPSSPESGNKLHPKGEISGAGTTNQMTKWLDGPGGMVGDSAVTEVGGKVGIGTTTPGGQLHIYGASNLDVFAGMGPDVISGPGFNYGYAGNSFGVGAGFFNVRPAMGATGVNPSLRFMTVDTQRMIITNAGSVGIGTSTPGSILDVNGNVNAGSVTIAGDLALPATASASTGVITLGGNRFAHSFGINSTFLGPNAGNFTMSGGYNTAIGDYALHSNTTGGDNIAIGDEAGFNLTTGNFNIDIGNGGVAAEGNTIRIGSGGVQTRAFVAGINGATIAGNGAAVLVDVNGQLGTVGGSAPTSANTPNAIVQRDGSGNFSSGTITLAGDLALPITASASAGVITLGGGSFAHNFGTNNTFLGLNAGNFAMTGLGYNTTVGASALNSNTSGCCNTASGVNALLNNTTGNDNTASGNAALYFNTTGGGNIAVGNHAGFNLTTGSNNIDIGNFGNAAEASTIRIGIVGTQTRAFVAGINGVTTGGAAVAVLIDSNGQLGTVSSSRRFKFDIADMGEATEGLMRLRPVRFRYLAHGENALLQYGLIAEEVAEVYPELVTHSKDGQVETVMYQFLAPMLLNEVQKQHQQIAEQQAENVALRDQLEKLMRRVEQLEAKRTAAQ